MAAIAHQPAAIELRVPHGARAIAGSAGRLSLRATEDGWSLLGPDGEVAFRALGVGGRRRCLQFARELGVLAVIS